MRTRRCGASQHVVRGALRRATRRGISLLEVMVALTILGTSLIGMAEYGRRFARTNANSAMLNNALDLASARVERVKAERNYTSMDTLARTETVISGYAGQRAAERHPSNGPGQAQLRFLCLVVLHKCVRSQTYRSVHKALCPVEIFRYFFDIC